MLRKCIQGKNYGKEWSIESLPRYFSRMPSERETPRLLYAVTSLHFVAFATLVQGGAKRASSSRDSQTPSCNSHAIFTAVSYKSSLFRMFEKLFPHDSVLFQTQEVLVCVCVLIFFKKRGMHGNVENILFRKLLNFYHTQLTQETRVHSSFLQNNQSV